MQGTSPHAIRNPAYSKGSQAHTGSVTGYACMEWGITIPHCPLRAFCVILCTATPRWGKTGLLQNQAHQPSLNETQRGLFD